ncbi:MAG: ShlB/FhaC/HecB family hemolysin secretion/activation protein [Nostocales cyanobacterium 94392]|nr:ShlB/FhaC/HecB family hemolysin secretion/activation protein [Nostocales cyanobacterium 94392]
MLANTLNTESAKAQITPNAPASDIQRGIQPTLPTPTPEILPPVEDLLPSPATPSTSGNVEVLPSELEGTIKVEKFQVEGSTVFSQEKLADITKDLTGREITFAELLQAADDVTKLYVDEGYITSGAYIPANQTFNKEGSIVTIKVVEGSLESIEVKGTKRLNPAYVRSRLAIATGKPLNQKKLLEALQLLQLDPLIKNLSGELAAGITPGSNILSVKVTEAKTRTAQIKLDNNRAPSIGSFQRQVQLNEANLLGLGDGLNIAYANTDGSNSWNASYTLPVNPRNGTLQLNYSDASTKVIEKPFDVLDIEGNSKEYGITFRQPVIQTPRKEFALGITANRRESDIGFLESLIGERLPYPSPGADKDGKTKVSTVRFFQDWTQRNTKQVIAARSEFSLGVNAFDATINDNGPDGEFISWKGQGQWVRLLAPETLLLVRGNLQFADRALLPSEQIGIGGQSTVRGYRQDLLLADNGLISSAELRYPVVRVPQIKGLLSVTPFIDFGTAWNNSGSSENLKNNTLASTGLGLLWQQNDRLTARLDWGIPLISIDSNSSKDSWQENGLYFSIVYTQSF